MKENSLKINVNREIQKNYIELKEGLFVRVETGYPATFTRTVRIREIELAEVAGNLLNGIPMRWDIKEFEENFVRVIDESSVLEELVREFKTRFETDKSESPQPTIQGLFIDDFSDYILKDYGTPFESLIGYSKKYDRTVCLYKSGRFAKADIRANTAIIDDTGFAQKIVVNIAEVNVERYRNEVLKIAYKYEVMKTCKEKKICFEDWLKKKEKSNEFKLST